MYSALDAGIGHDKERHLSTGLETIIETMALSSGKYLDFYDNESCQNLNIDLPPSFVSKHICFLGDDEGIESDQYDTEIDEPLSLEHNR